jgi:hypothetical protein
MQVVVPPDENTIIPLGLKVIPHETVKNITTHRKIRLFLAEFL